MAETPPISPLLADLITANITAANATANALIDSLTRQRDTTQATVAAIRTQILDLLDGPYAPSESAIRRALWPTGEVVDRFREVTDRG